MPPRLRIGVAGLGRAGAAMLAAMLQHRDVQVTAAADPRPEPRDRFVTDVGGAAYATVEEMAASPNVDAVYVAEDAHKRTYGETVRITANVAERLRTRPLEHFWHVG